MTEAPEKTKILRGLAAILAADIADYSTRMGVDEAGTVRVLKVSGRRTPHDHTARRPHL